MRTTKLTELLCNTRTGKNKGLVNVNIKTSEMSGESPNWMKNTSQKMKFSIKDFFSKCDQICRKLQNFGLNLNQTNSFKQTGFYSHKKMLWIISSHFCLQLNSVLILHVFTPNLVSFFSCEYKLELRKSACHIY